MLKSTAMVVFLIKFDELFMKIVLKNITYDTVDKLSFKFY